MGVEETPTWTWWFHSIFSHAFSRESLQMWHRVSSQIWNISTPKPSSYFTTQKTHWHHASNSCVQKQAAKPFQQRPRQPKLKHSHQAKHLLHRPVDHCWTPPRSQGLPWRQKIPRKTLPTLSTRRATHPRVHSNLLTSDLSHPRHT